MENRKHVSETNPKRYIEKVASSIVEKLNIRPITIMDGDFVLAINKGMSANGNMSNFNGFDNELLQNAFRPIRDMVVRNGYWQIDKPNIFIFPMSDQRSFGIVVGKNKVNLVGVCQGHAENVEDAKCLSDMIECIKVLIDKVNHFTENVEAKSMVNDLFKNSNPMENEPDFDPDNEDFSEEYDDGYADENEN